MSLYRGSSNCTALKQESHDPKKVFGPGLSQLWRGLRTITHPSGYTPDDAAGQGTVYMHCIGHPPTNIGVAASKSRETPKTSMNLRVRRPKVCKSFPVWRFCRWS